MPIHDSDYQGGFTIPAPKGVYQAAGDTNVGVDYAYNAVNMRTERGLLATSYGIGRTQFADLPAQIGTLERFYRRNKPSDPEVFVAAAGGAIYTFTAGASAWMKQQEGFNSDVWSCVTYEMVVDGATVDILIMSNADDGMIVVRGDTLAVEKRPLQIGTNATEVKFAVLGRHAERIWGTGDKKNPDNVFYSRPYNPFDWSGDSETPSMAGGMIQQPTWDGEAFIALVPFGGYLLAIKPSTCYEIRGTDPSSFTITEAYGTDGPVNARTIGVDRLSMFYLTDAGLGRYDGSSLSLLSRNALYETMRMRDLTVADKATACVCNHVYYLALAVKENEDDSLLENNTVIEFDTERGTFMLRKGIRVKDFYSIGGKVYFTTAEASSQVLLYDDVTASGNLGLPVESVWETGWLDLGKAYTKRDFVLRFTAEADEDDVPLEISIITERREKIKPVVLAKERRSYKVKIQNAGLRVKLRMRSNRASGWRIHGGVQVEYSYDQE